MIGFVFGGEIGKRNDRRLCTRSGLNRKLRDCQIGNARQFTSSEDKGFNPQSRLLPLHQEPTTPEEAQDNVKTSSVRAPLVEYLFKDVLQQNSFLDNYKQQKVNLNPVVQQYYVCCILRNAMTCCRAGGTAKLIIFVAHYGWRSV